MSQIDFLQRAAGCPGTQTVKGSTRGESAWTVLRASAYPERMCAGCALAAMTGASATRSWLQAQHITWLTPKRMRVATVALFTAATIGSSATLGGSGPAHSGPSHHPAVLTDR